MHATCLDSFKTTEICALQMNLVWHSKLRGPHLVGAESTGNLTPQPDFPHFWYSRSEAATTDGVSLWNKKHLGENMCRCMLAWNYVKGLAIWEMNQKTEPFQRIWERFGNKTTFVKPNSQHHPPSLGGLLRAPHGVWDRGILVPGLTRWVLN